MLLWLDIVIMLNEMSGMVCFLASAVLFLWFSLFDVLFLNIQVMALVILSVPFPFPFLFLSAMPSTPAALLVTSGRPPAGASYWRPCSVGLALVRPGSCWGHPYCFHFDSLSPFLLFLPLICSFDVFTCFVRLFHSFNSFILILLI